MDKITLKKGILILISIIGIFACTKEITDDLIASFELTENHTAESFLNISQPTEINIKSSERIDINGFEWKYQVTQGTGFYTINNEVVSQEEFVPLNSQQINIRYTGSTLGEHKVVVTVKSPNNRERTVELSYSINDTAFVFKAETLSSVSINETVAIDMNITEVSSATYKTKYSILNSDVDGSGAGSIKVGDETLSPDTFINVTKGDFSWSFDAASLGNVEILLTTKSSFDIEVKKTISINVTELSTYTFEVVSVVSEAITNDEVVLNFTITDNGVSSAYKMTYTTSLSGTLLYDGQTYAAGDEIPIIAGAVTANYTGVEIGEHVIDFKVVNSNQVPIEKTASVILNYLDSSTELPVITLNGDNPKTLIVGDSYKELATANDPQDGDLTTNIIFGGNFDGTSNTVGTFIRTYDVMDNENNEAIQKTRTIIVKPESDTEAPVILLNGGGETITLEIGDIYTEAATASDNVDGDITAAIVFGGNFDGTTTTEGTFTRTYNVSDAAGNAAVEVIRTVNVVENNTDTTAPVITLLGDSPLILTLGDTYIEPGATATDNVDGDISANITIDNSGVNTSITGNYQVTYNVSDAVGNSATEVIRTVTVTESNTDTTAPVITLLGDNPLVLNLGDAYVEPGATATDNVDGDISTNITINSSDVNIGLAGSYQVTYNVSDASGNAAIEVIRTVTVEPLPDGTAPVITLLGDNPLVLNLGDAYVELGATATDNVDGDISANIIINSSNVNIGLAGSYQVTYNVSDAAGNAAIEVIRTVTVEPLPDTIAPVIALNGGGGSVTLTLGDVYTEAATATDNVDGTITANIVFGGNFDGTTTTEGTFTRTYNVSDAAGNAATEKTRTIIIEPLPDTTPPVITINGGNIILNEGDAYTELGAQAIDNVDGNISTNITINSNVNTDLVGSYQVTYNVSDISGNAAIEKTRTVTVKSLASFDPVTGVVTGRAGKIVKLTITSLNSGSWNARLDAKINGTLVGRVWICSGNGVGTDVCTETTNINSFEITMPNGNVDVSAKHWSAGTSGNNSSSLVEIKVGDEIFSTTLGVNQTIPQ